MLRIKLKKDEKLPFIEFSRKHGVEEACPECGSKFTIFFNKIDFRKWFHGECGFCGNRIYLGDKECDLLQPSSRLFKIYYGFDPIAEEMVERKNKRWEEEKKLESLDESLDKKFSKPWERKFVKNIILGKQYG